MRRRWCLLGLALVVVALTSDAKPIAFVQPVRLVVLPPYGGTEIPVQTRIPVTADNRAWRLEWDGDACAGGSSVRELHGADDPAIMPAERPLEVRVFAGGVCAFAAAVFDGRGRILARGEIAVHTGTPAVTFVTFRPVLAGVIRRSAVGARAVLLGNQARPAGLEPATFGSGGAIYGLFSGLFYRIRLGS